MAYSGQFTCDVCGSQKKVTNNWYLVSLDKCITVWPFDADNARQKRFATLCGENCLQKFVSQHLDRLQTHPQLQVAPETTPDSSRVQTPRRAMASR
jgi:hypothetical protein